MATNEKVDTALIAYNAVWQGWSGIEANNVDLVRRVGMTAALNSVDRYAQGLKGTPPEMHAFEAVFRAYQGMVPKVDPECSDIFAKVICGEMPAVDGIPLVSRFANKEHAKGGK